MMGAARGLALLVVAAGLLISIPSARAEGDPDALIKKGVELRRQGKEQEALEAFQRAAQIKRTPRVVAQIALAEQAMGVWVAAERDLKEALDGAGRDPWIVKNRRQLNDALQVIQNHLGSLQVLGKPTGADVLIDGDLVGPLPIATPLRLPVGEVTLTVRKPGYESVTRGVAIAKDQLVLENVTLVAALRAPPKVAGGGAGTTTAKPLLTLKPIAPPPEPEPESHPIYSRWWFWTAIGVVAIGAGTGTYLLLRDPSCPSGTNCRTWN